MKREIPAQSVFGTLNPQEKYLYLKALRKLGVHDDTCRCLYEKLKKESFEEEPVSPECAKKVIRILVREGYLNERRYAQELTRRLARSGYGPRRVKEELMRRRFAPKIIESTLTEPVEYADIGEVLEKRLATRPCDLSDRDGRAKLYQYLCRMGFSPSDAQNAIERKKAQSEYHEYQE